MNTTQAQLRATYRQRNGTWEGVVKDGTRVVASCGHKHVRRHQTTYMYGRSATDCAFLLLHEIDPQHERSQRPWWMQ